MGRDFVFKVGMYHLNDEPNFDYQLNRTLMWSGGDLTELARVGARIHDVASWERELLALADQALAEGRTAHAIAYYRMAEFFMFDGNPRKLATYQRAKQLFYDHYADVFAHGRIGRVEVAYEHGRLPVWVCRPADGPVRDVVVMHGGNDSYMEEFLPVVDYLCEAGFVVHLFEGPGQGAVLREQGMPFTHEWHRPVAAVLDAFGLTDVTIVGISLGAMLATRAAAFDNRIARVVAWSIFPTLLDVLVSTRSWPVRLAVRALLAAHAGPLVNAVLRRQMATDPLARWGIEHGMYSMGVDSPYAYLLAADRFRITDVADRVDQDVLVLGAANDHFIPIDFHKREIDCLSAVRSLTYRLFTDAEHAGNHCNAGNTQLVLDTIIDWINLMKSHPPATR